MKSFSHAFSGICVALIAWGGQGAAAEITYSEHIAPLLQQKCVDCHREGESAPFALTSYASTKRRARTIQRVVDDGFMPPWHAIGGDVAIDGDRRLSADELKILKAWIADGTPEGDPEKLPAPREFPDGWKLGEPDLILKMADAYELPAEGADIYRNFVIPTGLKKQRYLKAIEFRPSAPEVVHHAIFFIDVDGRARAVDEADEEIGFAEMPVGEGSGRNIGAWVPGTLPRPLPDGLSRTLPPQSDVVLQIHFHLSGKVEREQSTIGLYFDDKPPVKPFTSIQLPPVFGAFSGIDLQPGAAEVVVADSFVLPIDVHAFGVQPHSHYRGKSLRMTADLPDGKTLTVLNIPEWDMNWQEEYRFSEQLFLPRGTRLNSTIVWDNSAQSVSNPIVPPVRVRWGLESYDEMGSIDLMVVPTGKTKQANAAMKTLRNRYREHVVWTAGSHVLSDDKLTIFGKLRDQAIGNFDANGDGLLDVDERELARRELGKKTLP